MSPRTFQGIASKHQDIEIELCNKQKRVDYNIYAQTAGNSIVVKYRLYTACYHIKVKYRAKSAL